LDSEWNFGDFDRIRTGSLNGTDQIELDDFELEFNVLREMALRFVVSTLTANIDTSQRSLCAMDLAEFENVLLK